MASGDNVKDLLDGVIVNSNGQKVTIADLKKDGKVKYIGLYFSAHWCPPCRGFTPQLVEFYKSFKESNGLEIIFISSDRDQNAFDGYYETMPWLALSFEHRDKKQKLCEKFGVSGIPTLILLDAETLEVTDREARQTVMSQPSEFTWK